MSAFGWYLAELRIPHFPSSRHNRVSKVVLFLLDIGMASSTLWPRFQKYFLRYDDLDFSIDISRMRFSDDYFSKMQPRVEKAFTAMRQLEAGAIANPDEQ